MLFVLLITLIGHTTGEAATVVIDSYTNSSVLQSGGSVPFGTQIILVCHVVGLPYGTPLNYIWTCPNGPCEVEGYYGRKVYNKHILVVSTTSTSDGGKYICQVTAAGGQEATGSFILKVAGGHVVHSFGRIIPQFFPITDLQQISVPDGTFGSINCTVNSGTATFSRLNKGQVEPVDLVFRRSRTTTLLIVRPTDMFENHEMYCRSQFYLYISDNSPHKIPYLLPANVTHEALQMHLMYKVQADERVSHGVAGYEVIRFGVPMIGTYSRIKKGQLVTISPVVPGARYKVLAWALGNGSRSIGPAKGYITAGETVPSHARSLTITRMLQDGVELNWLPPIEPNGEVHYVIEYKREDSEKWASVNTTRDSTHFNLTGLNCGTFRVVAMNSAGRASIMTPVKHPCSTPSPTIRTTTPTLNNSKPSGGTVHTIPDKINDVIIYSVVGVSALLAVLCLAAGIIFGVALRRRISKRKGEPSHGQGEPPQRRGEPPQRQGEPPQRQMEPLQRRGEPPQRRGEPPQRRGKPPQRQGEPPQRQGEPSQRLQMNDTIRMGRTAEEEHSNDYTYEYVNDGSSTDGRVALYQGLVARTQDYLSVYNQLNGETYQELDSQGREHDHHYQRANQGRERHGGRK